MFKNGHLPWTGKRIPALAGGSVGWMHFRETFRDGSHPGLTGTRAGSALALHLLVPENRRHSFPPIYVQDWHWHRCRDFFVDGRMLQGATSAAGEFGP